MITKCLKGPRSPHPLKKKTGATNNEFDVRQ